MEAGSGSSAEIFQRIYASILEYLVKSGFHVLIGLIILFIGFKIAGWLAKIFISLCQKRKLDVTLTNFLAMLVKAVVMAFAALIALDKFGITISPIIATVSAMIFGASFAIQAPLSNYAAGLAIIFARPFVVGNNITIQGYNGVVEEIKLPCTILATGYGEKITIPNKSIVGEVIVNSMANRVAETSVGISYQNDPEAAIAVVENALRDFNKISRSPRPQVGIQLFGDSAIVIGVRYWVPPLDYFQTQHDVNMGLFKALKKAGFTIPFPQRDVHIIADDKNFNK
jgi:small conductance mechanosensitive channel